MTFELRSTRKLGVDDLVQLLGVLVQRLAVDIVYIGLRTLDSRTPSHSPECLDISQRARCQPVPNFPSSIWQDMCLRIEDDFRQR